MQSISTIGLDIAKSTRKKISSQAALATSHRDAMLGAMK
jgi:hypothetical protein